MVWGGWRELGFRSDNWNMPLLETAPVSATAAARQAFENVAANLSALEATQPQLAGELGDLDFNGEWVFGRDGYLTARDEQGKWWSGCSLPMRSARTMLKHLNQDGVVGCMLLPTHAGQIAAALEIIQPQQAIVVIQPDRRQIEMFLHCGDFAADIARHRLWFITGENWREELEQLFGQWVGLPTPTQFIRIPGTPDEAINPMIEEAQAAFSRISSDRGNRLSAIPPNAAATKLLLIAPTEFRLWDDAGYAMMQSLGSEAEVLHLNPDDAQASALNLAQVAANASAILIPNRGRGELPIALPLGKAVLSWITQPRLWPFDPKYPRDGLLMADESWIGHAKRMGWPAERLAVAGWPTVPIPAANGETSLALISDTNSLEVPTTKLNFSSHHVLWEMIRNELLARPFSLGGDINAFIDQRRKKLGISDEGFNRDLFIGRLVLPCFTQAIARRLADAGMPLRIYGKGWDGVVGFADQECGIIRSRERFVGAVARATHLVYPWPVRHRHAIDALSRPVMTLHDGSQQEIRNSVLGATGRGTPRPVSAGEAEDTGLRVRRPVAPSLALHIDVIRRLLGDN